MKRIGHRIFLLLSSVRVESFVNAIKCLFVQQENESRVCCLSPTGWIVSIGAAEEELRPFKFCAKIWSARGTVHRRFLHAYNVMLFEKIIHQTTIWFVVYKFECCWHEKQREIWKNAVHSICRSQSTSKEFDKEKSASHIIKCAKKQNT